jgi:hypothetical protein
VPAKKAMAWRAGIFGSGGSQLVGFLGAPLAENS